ncbi:MAG: 3-phosphoserine/phosphohydroxythreonine transaminase [Tenacibaculum sp.]|nr:3-phosphoserine/phosphohydroxythreonine transaminase [Tenacibaculum sp.]
MKKHNFCAGPCILPNEVFKKASESLIDFNNSGLSILEISHRSDAFIEVIETARSLALELLELNPNDYSTLFLHGGASTQFLMVAYNFLNKKAGYINTGCWSEKAIKEAKFFGELTEIASSKNQDFNYIPKNFEIPLNIDYLHITSNNTIYGTQFKEFPKTDIPLICDMSSDILSRKIDYSKFSLIYAGAQKNIGTAGTALVVIKKDFLAKITREIPSMMSYKTHIQHKSMFNTPPVFAIYTAMLNLQWLKKIGGVEFIEKVNDKKAKLLYSEIDRNPLFKGTAKKEDRSTMNATFILTNEKLKPIFDEMWKEAEINGLNGHRSVGGYRASMYNALPLYSVQTLVDVMIELERKA